MRPELRATFGRVRIKSGTRYAVSIDMRTSIAGGRKCAFCGKDMGQGQAPAAWTLLVKWSKEAGIRLEAPESSYLDPRCARKLQQAMTRPHSYGRK